MDKEFTLDDWMASKPEGYELTQEQIDELQALLAPAAAKCRELRIPFVFAYQGALMDDGIRCCMNGSTGISTPERVGPNALLSQVLFNRENPEQALAMVSYAVNKRAEVSAPSIILTH